MPVKHYLRSLVRSAWRIPPIKQVFYHPIVFGKIRNWPGFRQLYDGGADLKHPFDRYHHTNTSGYAVDEEALRKHGYSSKTSVYIGSQPSIIRTALKTLPPLERFTFVDLGCGKGRPLLVASAFTFKHIIGVELSPSLVQDAQKNVSVLKQRFPGKAIPQVELSDASTYRFPPGPIVLFLYNPFGEEVIGKVIANIEEALVIDNRSFYVIYYNPVHGRCFDASRRFSRYFAATLAYSNEEIGYGPDETDSVVIWQAGSTLPPIDGATARIHITKPGIRAELET